MRNRPDWPPTARLGIPGLVAAVVALSAGAVAAQRAGRVPRGLLGVACQSGRFEILATSRIGGPFDGLEIELLGSQLAILEHCPAIPARVRLTSAGTELHAAWPRCAGFPAGVGIDGVVDVATCSEVTGEIRVGGEAAPIPLLARQRLLTGDDTVGGGDPGGGNPDDGGGSSSSSNAAHKGFQRWYVDFSQRAHPVGFVPPGALKKGFGEVSVAPIALERWVGIGPAPMRTSPGDATESPRSINTGRVNAVAVDPADPAHWLIGAANGGVWESPDAGATWAPRTDDQPSLAISAIAFSPSAPNVVYAGTGAYDPLGTSSYPGVGILKSIDGGETWGLFGESELAGLGFGGIAVSPTSPSAAVVATVEAVPGAFYEAYLPAGGGQPGIYRTVTGGASWELRLAGRATAVVGHPTTPFFYLYAGLAKSASSLSREPSVGNRGLFRSLDGGQNWAPVGGPWNRRVGGIGEVRLAISPSDPDVLYASIRDAADKVGKDGYLLGVWKTENAWDAKPTWVALPTPVITPFGGHALLVHGVDPGVLFLASGGPPLWKWAGGQWLVDSQKVPTDPQSENLIHVDHRALAWVGTESLLVGNDGGVYLKNEVDDGPWIHRNDGLAITQFVGGSVLPSDPDAVLGGAIDNSVSVLLPPAGPLWRKLSTGDGMGGFFADTPGRLAFALQYGILQRSLDAGATSFNGLFALSALDFGGAWYTRASRCLHDEDTVLYAGHLKVFKSTNFFSAAAFQSIAWTATGAEFSSPLTAIAFAPTDLGCDTYAIARYNGRIELTTDDGANWKLLNPPGVLPARVPTALAFASDDPDQLWVTFSGFDAATPGSPGHLFRTDDATAPSPTWSNSSPPVDLPFHDVSVHPADADIVYVGCDLGVWSTGDGGATWMHHGPEIGMPHVPVMDLEVGLCGTTAFTYGRSAFRTISPIVPLCDE